MVDQELLERASRLDAEARRELRDALDDSPPVEITPELAALLDERLADAEAHPEEGIPWEDVRGRMRTKVAQAKKSA